MAGSVRKELRQMLLVIILAVTITIFIEFLLQYLELYFPTLILYDTYIKYVTYAIIILGFAVIISHITKNLLESVSIKIGGRNLNGVYTILRAFIYGIAIMAVFLTMGLYIKNLCDRYWNKTFFQ